MPDWNARQVAWPLLEQAVVGIFIAVDHVRYKAPVEAGMAVPVIHPAGVACDVKRTAFLPHGKSAVVEHEGLAGICHDAHVVLAWERHQGMSAGEEACRVLARTSDRGAVVVDHAFSLLGSAPDAAY